MEPSYIWMKSGKLRNPLNPRVPQRLMPRQVNDTRPLSSTSSNSARRLKTTTSHYWFAYSQLPGHVRSHADDTVGQPPWSASATTDHLYNKELSRPGTERPYTGRERERSPSADRSRIKSSHVGVSGRHTSLSETHKRSREADESDQEDESILELCPNVYRRSSSMAGLRSVRERLASTEIVLSPELRPKTVHHQRPSERSQPRTSSATISTRSGLRPSSGVTSTGRSTVSPRAVPLSPWTESEVKPSEVSSETMSPRCPSDRKILRSSVRPLSAVHTSAKVKRLIDERLRTIYQDRRVQSATFRRLEMTPCLATPCRNLDTPRTPVMAHTPQSLQEEEVDESPPSLALASFQRAVKLVILARSVLKVSIANSLDTTPRSATELQWLTVYAEREDTTLTFNKHLFSRERVTTHVPEWAQEILSLRPETRTEPQCRRLHALLRGLKSFDKFTEEIQMSLCKAFTMERLEERRVVLKKGHVGQNFYFIYSGSVFVNQEDTTKDGNTFVRTVAVLARGDSFGELALLQDIRRTATITVRERCELLMVEKSVFASVCPAIFERELEEKNKFIKSLSLFSGKWWTEESLWEVSLNSQLQEYKTNKVIAADSALEDWIYACVQGCCQIVRCICLDRPKKKEKHGKKDSDSEIVLSEEILHLLSTAMDDRGSATAGDTKKNLLTSLGLDYINTGKKHAAAMMDVNHSEQTKARLGLNGGTTTLTSLMKRQRELLKKELVYLDVGKIGAGEIFDLRSITEHVPTPDELSSLMLISGGAKVLKIRKGIFYERANQQAINHTRTLASKERNPPEDVLLHSYEERVAWEDYKDSLMKNVVKNRSTRTAPLYRDPTRILTPVKPAKGREKTQIISALRERSKSMRGPLDAKSWSSDSGSSDDEDNEPKNRIQSRMGETESIFKAILKESENKTGAPRFADLVIIHRKPPPSGKKIKVSKEPVPPPKPVRPFRRILAS